MRHSLLSPARAFTLVAALAFAPAALAQNATFTDQQKKAIGEVVREYLLANPQVLQEAMVEFEKRQNEAQRVAQQTAIRELKQSLINAPHSYVAGNPTGDVTLVEFFDYNCGFCKQSLVDLRGLMKVDPKLRVVLKDFPVLGPDSVEASRVALAAKEQLKGDKAFEYHAKLMETRGRVNGERALAVAREMGLDLARVQKDMESQTVKAALQENASLGDRLNLSGTPAFIVGEEVIPGAVGVDPLRQLVANVRACGKAQC